MGLPGILGNYIIRFFLELKAEGWLGEMCLGLQFDNAIQSWGFWCIPKGSNQAAWTTGNNRTGKKVLEELVKEDLSLCVLLSLLFGISFNSLATAMICWEICSLELLASEGRTWRKIKEEAYLNLSTYLSSVYLDLSLLGQLSNLSLLVIFYVYGSSLLLI